MTTSISQSGSWEPAESAALTALIKPGARVIDVGAHVGYMTRLLAARTGSAGHVLAIEANPDNFELLQANMAFNPAAHVRLVLGAAWRRSGETLTMTISSENTGDHRVFERAQASATADISSLALDDLIPEEWPLDLAKVDAQGTDHVAIEGMERTIQRCWPTIVVEFWPVGIEEFGGEPAQVLSLYRDLGYELTVLELPALRRDAGMLEIVERARVCRDEYCTLLLRPDLDVERGP
jgi:FkbM family methyltransferase